MPNDMMIAALNAQRASKMDLKPQEPSGQDKSGGLEARVSELEKMYQDLCEYVGMKKEEKDPATAEKAY